MKAEIVFNEYGKNTGFVYTLYNNFSIKSEICNDTIHIEANKLNIYKEYATKQEQNQGNLLKSIDSMKDFMSKYPDYYNTLEQMLDEAKDNAKIYIGPSYSDYFDQYQRIKNYNLF